MALRLGILGAASIAPLAVVRPARAVAEVAVHGIAARDPARAEAFARQHGIPRAYPSYAGLLADPEIDAIYNPLPNGLHGRWTIAAIEAGKHVLCEKPFTANAEEAERVAAAAAGSGLVVMEAFHYRYHALTARMLEIIDSGELGQLRHIAAWFCIPLLKRDIRWRLDLAGGALMDAGCYPIHLIRTLAGAEPTVRAARAKLISPDVDRVLEAELEFADGRTASVIASMLSRRLLGIGAKVVGAAGTMQVFNFIMPQLGHSLTIRSHRGRRKERVAKLPSSYEAQLRAFAGAVLSGQPFPTTVRDSVGNMRVIDACYAAAGLPRREPTLMP